MNMPKGPGFKITGGKGFHITFENGYTVSVQFGPGNYCDNYGRYISEASERKAGEDGSTTAEVAVWSADGEMLERPEFGGDTVGAKFSPAQVLDLLNWAAKS